MTGLSKAVFRQVLHDFRNENFGRPIQETTPVQTKLANDPVVMAGAIAHETYHEHRTD